MATNPEIPPPDRIEPQSPPETPPDSPPSEDPFREPPEIVPERPDYDAPDRGPQETPPPPDLGDWRVGGGERTYLPLPFRGEGRGEGPAGCPFSDGIPHFPSPGSASPHHPLP